jgi:hypothetical protein
MQTPSQSIALESAFSFDFADLLGYKKDDLITYYESEEKVAARKSALQDAKKAQAATKGGDISPEDEEELQKIASAKEETRIRAIVWK